MKPLADFPLAARKAIILATLLACFLAATVTVQLLPPRYEARNRLLGLKERLENKADFAAIARVHSEDASASRGGDLGDRGVVIAVLRNRRDHPHGEAIALIAGRAKVEISGGVTLDRIPEIASLGADFVSVGALTHSAPAADISLEIETA